MARAYQLELTSPNRSYATPFSPLPARGCVPLAVRIAIVYPAIDLGALDLPPGAERVANGSPASCPRPVQDPRHCVCAAPPKCASLNAHAMDRAAVRLVVVPHPDKSTSPLEIVEYVSYVLLSSDAVGVSSHDLDHGLAAAPGCSIPCGPRTPSRGMAGRAEPLRLRGLRSATHGHFGASALDWRSRRWSPRRRRHRSRLDFGRPCRRGDRLRREPILAARAGGGFHSGRLEPLAWLRFPGQGWRVQSTPRHLPQRRHARAAGWLVGPAS